jgi:steroid delta-isomerase-like uncharacterized protein
MLTADRAKQHVDNFVRALNDHDGEKMSSALADNAVLNDPFLPAPLESKQSIVQFWSGIFQSFPTMSYRVDETVVGDGKVFVAFTTTGKGKGSFAGANVDGKQFEIQEGNLFQMDDQGLISKITVFVDTANLSKQLGL